MAHASTAEPMRAFDQSEEGDGRRQGEGCDPSNVLKPSAIAKSRIYAFLPCLIMFAVFPLLTCSAMTYFGLGVVWGEAEFLRSVVSCSFVSQLHRAIAHGHPLGAELKMARRR